MFDVMGWPYLCLYNIAYKQVGSPFVELMESLQPIADNLLAAREISYLSVQLEPFSLLDNSLQAQNQVHHKTESILQFESRGSLRVVAPPV